MAFFPQEVRDDADQSVSPAPWAVHSHVLRALLSFTLNFPATVQISRALEELPRRAHIDFLRAQGTSES